MSRSVDVIEILRRANPVPPGTEEDAAPPLNEIFGSSWERNGGQMSSSTITKPAGGIDEARPRWPKYLGVAAALVVVFALTVPFVGPGTSSISWGEVPADQRETVAQVLEAVNERDPAEFAAAFAPGASFSTYIDYEMRASCCDSYPVEDASKVQAWMDVVGVWGLEAEIEACEAEGSGTVRCQVTSRWNRLHMEMPEQWLFVFDGSSLRSWGMLFQGSDDPPGTLPLGYPDLAEWEEWLEANHPDQAARLLVPRIERMRTEGSGMLSINGVAYESNILRYDPALVDDIDVSIEEYLASR